MGPYKHFLNRGRVAVYAALVLLFLAGVCGFFFLKPLSAEPQAAPIANAQPLSTEKRHIVAGGDYDYPPYEWIDKQGQPAGFNVDLMRAVAEVMGWEVTFHLGPWPGVRKNLATGKIDVLPMYSSKERFDVVDFTDPFEMIYYERFIRRGSQPVRSLDEMNGLEVIVQRDALMHD